MSNKLHASEGDKAVASRLYFNMIILFGLLENFHCHCERSEAISLLRLLRRFTPRNDISVLSLRALANNLTPRHPEGATRLKDLMIDHGILRLLRTTLSVGLLRSFLSLAMTFRVVFASL